MNNWVAYGMMLLASVMTCLIVGSLVMAGYCFLTTQYPTFVMLIWFAATIIESLATWQLDKYLSKKVSP